MLAVVSGTIGAESTGIPTRVLVFGMARPDRTIRAEDVYAVAEASGQSAEQVRSCLRRLVAEELFTRDGEGRDALYRLTDRGAHFWSGHLERHRLSYVQDRAGRGWDRRWHLVGFAVPEAQRDARDALRDWLRQLGGAPVQGGLFVSAHRWEEEVQGEVERLDVAEHVTYATTDELSVGGETDPRRLAARLWDLDGVAKRYAEFLTAYQDVPEALEAMRVRHEKLTDAEFLAGALATFVDFQEVVRHDPLLPPELLPRPWPGREARRLLAKVRRLGILAREHHDRPAMFTQFDEVLDEML
jgi:phenylacetic acid degradation operon negative regulatory protein